MAMRVVGDMLGVVAAMVGAGLASGREIMHFFSRYGMASYGMVALGTLVIALASGLVMRRGAMYNGRLHGGAWLRVPLAAAMASTGGGMLAAMGEICRLLCPFAHAYEWGMAFFLALAWLLCRRGLAPLRFSGVLLVPLLLAAFILCMRVPPISAQRIDAAPPLAAGIGQAVGYALLNVSLAAGVLCEAGARCGTPRARSACAWGLSVVMGGLLLLGNAALLRHVPKYESAALPVVLLLRHFGTTGFLLAALTLLIAAFSTLLGVLRTLERMLPEKPCAWQGLPAAVIALCAALGFERVVGRLYPVMGWLGLAALLIWSLRKQPNKIGAF